MKTGGGGWALLTKGDARIVIYGGKGQNVRKTIKKLA
jgi:hypothetical protein